MTDDEWLEFIRQFFHFIKNRASFRNEDELKRSYEEFKKSVSESPPDFHSFLEKLKSLKVISRKGDKIHFKLPTAPPAANGKRKAAEKILQELKSNSSSDLVFDKNGVSITSDPPFNEGKLQMGVGFKIDRKVKIENSGKAPVELTDYFFLSKVNNFTLGNKGKGTPQDPPRLQPGESCEIPLIFRCKIGGLYSAKVAFEFTADRKTGSAFFYIVRFIEARCVTPLGRALGPVRPFKRRQRVWRPVDNQKIIGKRNQPRRKILNERKMRSLVSGKDQTPERALLESGLTWQNYTEKLQLLLDLEKYQVVQDYQGFNIYNDEQDPAKMEWDGKYFVLVLPESSRNRPPLKYGDELFVCPVGVRKHLCSVVRVQQWGVTLNVPPGLARIFHENMRFDVQFIADTKFLDRLRGAVEQDSRRGMQELLFPVTRSLEVQLRDLRIDRLFDERIRGNTEQYQAVQHIVYGSSLPAPYLVFGPPGSGKTTTLVEAIRQIERNNKVCLILACAHTNRAAIQLCKKIRNPDNEGKVFHLYGGNSKPTEVPKGIKRCCQWRPLPEDWLSYRIIVTTLFSASRLVPKVVGAKHFTHVFVDEAEDASEAECLIPLAGLAREGRSQVVLAGDPKQLGPIVKSATARKYGLGVSLLERLLIAFSGNGSVDGPFDCYYVTKLLLSYRSHPDILEVPRVLFYKDALKPFADDCWSDFCHWEGLRQKGFPVIFHVVRGCEDREGSNPSFFNVDEVEVLIEYVHSLLRAEDKDGSKVKPKDIGIIAPYNKQVEKVQKVLKTLDGADMEDLKVGTVERFQGDERRIILVSTVRSSAENSHNNEKHQVGLVGNEKKFNVALTRANALLIVVGNPSVLETSHDWKTFIKFCKSKGGYYCPEDYQNGEEEDEDKDE